MTPLPLIEFNLLPTPARELPIVTPERANDVPLGSELRITSKQSACFGAGGDFFEILEHGDGRVSTVVADVCGNGIEAAKFAALIRPFLHAVLTRGESPGRVLATLNDGLIDRGLADRFVTAVATRVDLTTGLVEIACAGHLGPFVRRASGRVQIADRPVGVPLGLLAGEQYDEVALHLAADDALVLVTDGITDPLSTERDPLGEVALAERLEHAPRFTKGICEALLADGTPARDDATVLVLQLPAVLAAPIAA